jgi:hypothetical protein
VVPALRRLNRWEYERTVRDLLGDVAAPPSRFPPEERAGGYDNNAAALTVSPALAYAYFDAAEALGRAAAANVRALVPCDPAGGTACARAFIARFGRRAFRRPLTADETARFGRVFDAGAQVDFASGVRLVVTAMLQSAPFLYRIDAGAPADVATRLSYLLWGTAPDDALLDRAEAGRLATREEVEGTVIAMARDPRFEAVIGRFLTLWLELGEVTGAHKDARMFPAFTPAVAASMDQESRRFIDEVAARPEGTLPRLLTTPATSVDARLATFYGAPAPPAGEPLHRVELDGGRRAGLLTLGSFLVLHSTATETSPVMRGTFVRRNLLCDPLPDPPDDVPVLPPPQRNVTTRERFARHATDPACAGCHALVDPIGYGLEAFDAVGRHRTTDMGKPVDTASILTASDNDGPFSGAVELARRLADSAKARRCAVTNAFRYALGRLEGEADACALRALEDRFERAGLRVRDLFAALAEAAAGGAP